MLIPGLVSVTFRRHLCSEIAQAMQKASISAIEWGGDVHVPPKNAEAIADAVTACSNFCCYPASFGSYYRCTSNDAEIDATVETALLLGTSHIRVWAGSKSSDDTDFAGRTETVQNLKKICCAAAKHGIIVSPEFHGGTLTDHYESAVRLIDEVAEKNLMLYWQPNQFRDDDYNRAALRATLPYISNVHVFTWDAVHRYPLSDGEKMWREYIDLLATSGRDHHLLLEFVCDDTIEQFYRDAETLHRWLQ